MQCILGHDGILIVSVSPPPAPDQTHLSPRSPGRWSLPSPSVCQFSPQCYERCHPPPDITHTLTSLYIHIDHLKHG